MEWGRVKSILIVLLLVANSILGINIAWQYMNINRTEKNSVRDACTLLAQRGVNFNNAIFEGMPVLMDQYSGSRSEAVESSLAKKMLGDYEVEQAGGGITKYTSPKGKITFRSGGFFEAELFERIEDGSQFIKSMGLSAKGDDSAFTMRLKDGLPVINAKISVEPRSESTIISGLWIFSEDITKNGVSLSRAELILGILTILEDKPSANINYVEPVYQLQEERGTGVSIIPMWKVGLDGEDIFINGLTKRLTTK